MKSLTIPGFNTTSWIFSYWIAPQTDDEIAGIIAELDYNEDGTVNVVEFVTEGEAASVGEAQDLDDYQDVSDLSAPS